MGQTTVNVRVDEDVKKGIENFCSSVGMNLSTAVNLFFKAVLNQGRIPFEISPRSRYKPRGLAGISKEELDSKIERGLADMEEGRYRLAEECFDELEQKHIQRYGV